MAFPSRTACGLTVWLELQRTCSKASIRLETHHLETFIISTFWYSQLVHSLAMDESENAGKNAKQSVFARGHAWTKQASFSSSHKPNRKSSIMIWSESASFRGGSL